VLKISLPEKAEKDFVAAAKRAGMSKSALATLAVATYLDKIQAEVESRGIVAENWSDFRDPVKKA
jgi:hypothetical protein